MYLCSLQNVRNNNLEPKIKTLMKKCMIKKIFLFGIALLAAGQFVAAQELYKITVSADGENTSYALSSVQKIVFDNNTMTVNMKSGSTLTNVTRIGFALGLPEIDYSKLKINEVSGVGNDPEKFYELINIGDVEISLAGCKLYYNANGSTGGVFPPDGNQGLTWTGNQTHVIQPNELLLLLGRYNASTNPGGAFTTGLTAQRILIITLEDPAGNVIDQCIRAEDTGIYDISDKSFSRIPDGTGDFYFTTPTPNLFNGNDASGLLLVPQSPSGITGIKNQKIESSIFVFPNPVKTYLTIEGVNEGAKIDLLDLNGTLLQSILTQDNSTNIDVSSLSQGMYLLQVEGQVVKFIKQ